MGRKRLNVSQRLRRDAAKDRPIAEYYDRHLAQHPQRGGAKRARAATAKEFHIGERHVQTIIARHKKTAADAQRIVEVVQAFAGSSSPKMELLRQWVTEREIRELDDVRLETLLRILRRVLKGRPLRKRLDGMK